MSVKYLTFFWPGQFRDNFSAEIVQLGDIFSAEIVQLRDIFSAEFVPTVKYLRGRFVFPYKVQALFESSLLSGSFLIKVSPLSASTTAED